MRATSRPQGCVDLFAVCKTFLQYDFVFLFPSLRLLVRGKPTHPASGVSQPLALRPPARNLEVDEVCGELVTLRHSFYAHLIFPSSAHEGVRGSGDFAAASRESREACPNRAGFPFGARLPAFAFAF